VNVAADLAGLSSLAGQRALVAGGCGAIGSAVSSTLQRAGAEVVCIDLPGRTAPAGTVFRACDLADAAAIRGLGTALTEGGRRFDVLVHCAGITCDGVLWKLADEDWNRVLRVNLDSAFHLMRLVLPGMRAAGAGRIVLLASINGERGKFGQTNYAASKAGLIALGKSAAKELGRLGIRVNVVSPGLIRTPMSEDLPPDVTAAAIGESALGRVGAPEDVARAVLFLCTELSAHITGQVLRVDGGQCTA
jgi:NAD(P)-dependent dehydrogenase (short-subunit alcohol dehydrogenase family)